MQPINKIARVAAVMICLVACGWFVEWYVSVLLVTYLCYVVVFAAKRERATYDKGSPTYKALTVLGYLFYVPGLPLDWLLNMLSSVPFADPPANSGELFTGRMRRYLLHYAPYHWRYRSAWALCRYLLHPWDNGHCLAGL